MSNIDLRINANIKISLKMTKLIGNVKLNCYNLCLAFVEVQEDMVLLGKEFMGRALTHFLT